MARTPPPHAWKPGQSGNPRGRPPGSGRVAALRNIIIAAAPDLILALVERAKAGDCNAARLLIERSVPAIRPVELATPINIPVGRVSDAGRAVLQAAGSGDLAASQAVQLMAALGTYSQVTHLDELDARLSALESAAHAAP